MTRNSSDGGQKAKVSDKGIAIKRRRSEWRRRAAELWAERPSRNQIAVATKIDPDPTKRRNIIRVIEDLDPRKQK